METKGSPRKRTSTSQKEKDTYDFHIEPKNGRVRRWRFRKPNVTSFILTALRSLRCRWIILKVDTEGTMDGIVAFDASIPHAAALKLLRIEFDGIVMPEKQYLPAARRAFKEAVKQHFYEAGEIPVQGKVKVTTKSPTSAEKPPKSPEKKQEEEEEEYDEEEEKRMQRLIRRQAELRRQQTPFMQHVVIKF
jgi:hypothetical protein